MADQQCRANRGCQHERTAWPAYVTELPPQVVSDQLAVVMGVHEELNVMCQEAPADRLNAQRNGRRSRAVISSLLMTSV
ncbi:MAG: hypothetical protein ACLS37_11395 [Alistipes sp.]